MTKRFSFQNLFGLMAILLLVGCQNAKPTKPKASTLPVNKWEPDIAKFEAEDAISMPASGGIVFVGSSSIRAWNVKEVFPGLNVLNRGFGGSQMADAARYCRRIVTKYQPRIVVLYSGDNDLASGVSPAGVLAAYRQFADTLHADVPNAKLVVISIKPSMSRWKLMPKMTEANKLIREDAVRRGWVQFLDIVPLLLGPDGKPDKEFFKPDGLHLNENGYALWNSALRPLLE